MCVTAYQGHTLSMPCAMLKVCISYLTTFPLAKGLQFLWHIIQLLGHYSTGNVKGVNTRDQNTNIVDFDKDMYGGDNLSCHDGCGDNGDDDDRYNCRFGNDGDDDIGNGHAGDNGDGDDDKDGEANGIGDVDANGK